LARYEAVSLAAKDLCSSLSKLVTAQLGKAELSSDFPCFGFVGFVIVIDFHGSLASPRLSNQMWLAFS
jgi:hypothetical protein